MPRHRLSERYGLPAAPAPAPVLPDLSRQNAVNARLGQFPLEQEARQAQIDRASASEAKARYDLTKQIETDRQRTAFYNGLQELEQNLSQRGFGIGTPQHAEAFAAYAHEFPLARSSADVNQTLKLHATVNDEQAALKQRMLELSPPPEKIAQRYARVQGDIQQFTDESAQREAANIAAGKANVQYTNAPKLHAAQTEAQLLERQYPQLSPNGTSETDTTQAPSTAPVPTMDTQVITPDATDTSTPSAAVVAPSVTPVPVQAATPQAGDIQQGYRFKGGAPHDPANWEQVGQPTEQ
jgi:hypothetical protein